MLHEMNLNGQWKFCPAFDEISADQRWMDPDFDPNNPEVKTISGEHIGWVQPGFSDDGWLDIAVPASWNSAIDDLWSYEGHGWYRRSVCVPKSWEGRRVEFFSEGANYRTVVYVNGEIAGEHEGGYTPFAIDVSHLLKYGEENLLSVAVDNLPMPSRAPGRQFGWWNHGGLYRDVSLRVMDRTRIDDVTVVTDVDDGTVAVSVSTVVLSDDAEAQRTMVTTLVDPTGTPVLLPAEVNKREIAIADGRAEAEMRFDVPNPMLWSPDSPELYTLTIELVDGNGRTDQWSHRIGLRTFRIDGGQLLLNGEPLLIKGINRHEDYPRTGRTHDEASLGRDLDLVQWVGANALRCHYPNHRHFYELCDERGIMNMVEVPLWQWGRPLVETDDPKALDAAKAQLHEIVKTYKNHAGVFIWSVSNENLTNLRSPGDPEAEQLAKMTADGNIELVHLTHELDPTRPVVEVSNEWPNDPVHNHTDIATVNVYVGSPSPPLPEHLDQPIGRLREKMAGVRAQVPGVPIIAGEYGEWTMIGLKTNHPPGEYFQSAKLTAFWDALMEEENVIGGFIWCFADYDVHRRFLWSHDYRLGYGIFDFHRRPKDAAYAVREQWKKT
jgi:beta-galactosidase/beta-glucuronidase